jgi:predicted Rossmann fold flavoprotein
VTEEIDSAIDIAIVGAGAAGLMAAAHAGRRLGPGARRIVVLDGARVLGAKILVAGGGRCNVTHYEVDESAFAGSSPKAIRKVLRRFDVPETRAFFAALGVELKQEETGKLFPTTDQARTVLDALLRAAREAGVEIRHPWRVETIERLEGETQGFLLQGPAGALRARAVILATGGQSLPKSGSDGHGYVLARALGHTTTPRLLQSLVPLLMPRSHPLCALSGLATPARLEAQSASGKRIQAFEGPVLLTHFGLSGPCVLDVSRYLLDARADDPGARLVADWLPQVAREAVERRLLELRGEHPRTWLSTLLPKRLADTLCVLAGVDPGPARLDLTKAARRSLLQTLKALELPIEGPRGWNVAEVTAGGVPLSEIRLETMESRRTPGLYFCGEILDVDGRIGGFNFQWAWASGYVAGASA